MVLAGNAAAQAAGAQGTNVVSEGQFGSTLGMSAVFVEQLNVFEGQYHSKQMTMCGDIGMMVAKQRLRLDGKATMKEIWHPTLPQPLGLHSEKSLGCLLKK